jgi:hypothetical protein
VLQDTGIRWLAERKDVTFLSTYSSRMRETQREVERGLKLRPVCVRFSPFHGSRNASVFAKRQPSKGNHLLHSDDFLIFNHFFFNHSKKNLPSRSRYFTIHVVCNRPVFPSPV